MSGVRTVLNEAAILNILWSRFCSLVLAFGMSLLYSANLRVGSISYWLFERRELKGQSLEGMVFSVWISWSQGGLGWDTDIFLKQEPLEHGQG